MVYTENLFLENLSISIFKNKKGISIYMYNKDYYCLIKISLKIQLKLKNQKCLIFNYSDLLLQQTLQKMELFLRQFYLCKFTKIKFTGKGYKIKKNTAKSIVLLFNRAHITSMWWKNNFLKKLKKYKIYIKYTNKNASLIRTLLDIRPVNIFTKKGLRESRQILLKKKGKK